MDDVSVTEHRPEIIELYGERECCVNFRLEIERNEYSPSITGSIGERFHGKGDWKQIFYIPISERHFKGELEQSALILERVAALLRLEGKKLLESLDSENEDRVMPKIKIGDVSVLESRPEIVELFSSRMCCVNFRLEIDRDSYYPSITGSIGEVHCGGDSDWQRVFYISLERDERRRSSGYKDLSHSALVLERVAAHLRLEGKKLNDLLEDDDEDDE